jgi:hypothetical protein
MARAAKAFRRITVDGAVYRWRLGPAPSCSPRCSDAPLAFAVKPDAAGGRVLEVVMPDVSHPASHVGDSSLIVRPALVAAAIQMALSRGWQSAASSGPFLLKVVSGDLPAEVKTEMIPGDPWLRL